MFTELAESWRYRAVVENFVRTSLAVRYRRSVLGYLWSVLSPLLKYVVMGVVFELVGRFTMTNYYGFMFIGSVYFGYISTVATTATTIFISNEHYIKKIYVPKFVFIFNVVISEFVNFVLVLVAVLFLLTFLGQVTPSVCWLFLPIPIVITLLFATGLAALLALATVYFRDLQHLTEIVFQALFFATPIFYPIDVLQKSPLLYAIASLNPILYLVEMFRKPLIEGSIPSLETSLISLSAAAVVFILGVTLVRRFNNRIVFKL